MRPNKILTSTTSQIPTPSDIPIYEQYPLQLHIPMFFGLGVGFLATFILQVSTTTEVRRNMVEEEKKNSTTQSKPPPVEDTSLESNHDSPAPMLNFYDWDNISKEAVGIIVAGNSGSAKTCLTTWLLGKLTQEKPAQVVILDPHANRNPLWEELGVITINDFKLIEQQLIYLEELLDNRRNQPDNGDTVITVAEELGACIKNFSDPSRAQRTLERLGSEGRKYGLVLISVNTSANVDDIGISAQSRNNFVTILCGAAARDYTSNKWKQTDERHIWVRETAYPTVITGAVPGCVAVHPTHGHHEKYAILGKEPKGILPVNQSPLTIPLATDDKELNISSNAEKLFKWFESKTSSLDDSFSLRSIAQSKPLGKKESHKFEILIPLIEELQQAELILETSNQSYRLAT